MHVCTHNAINKCISQQIKTVAGMCVCVCATGIISSLAVMWVGSVCDLFAYGLADCGARENVQT